MSVSCLKHFTLTVAEDVVFWNTEQVYSATCPGGKLGGPSNATVPAHTYSSVVSQAAADAIALAAAQAEAEAALFCCDPPGDANSLTMTPTVLWPDPGHVSLLHTEGASQGTWSITETSAPPFPLPHAVSWQSNAFCNPNESDMAVAGAVGYSIADTTFLPPATAIFEFSVTINLLRESDSSVVATDSKSHTASELPIVAGTLALNANVPKGRYYFSVAVTVINGDTIGNFSVSSA